MCRTCNMQWRKRACSLHWCSWMLAICIICNGFGIEFKHSDNTQKLAFNLCALGVEDLWSIANIYTAYPVLMLFLYQHIVHGNISGKNENANSMKLYSKWSAFSASTNGAYWNFASKYSVGFTSLKVIPPISVLNQFQRMNDGASSNVHNYMDDFYELAPTDGELLSFKVIDEPVNLLINR